MLAFATRHCLLVLSHLFGCEEPTREAMALLVSALNKILGVYGTGFFDFGL